ncbi:MAG: alginate export family protein [Flavobacterium nitrogenifigens]|uniref:alginate export family protein n=1 Tax=Flavobacterium nitrogenifigens TaxID=1617283 RepID=UPI002806AE2D|nr:alginate export family protein [Flavobacterium nitrogenifigens]MDQ8013569.1 alginate export family protein [Flavobacterium nitrogenifigens]
MKKLKLILILIVGLSFEIQAQELDVNLQIRPRFEYRNGYKQPLQYGQEGTSQISQRSRLGINYKQEDLIVKLSLQNTRTWGDVPTTTTSDKNGVAVFEAWAQYNFTEKWSARMGRQVLSYDNQRILGGLDWAQQGQSHDALIVSFHNETQKLDFGGAYNSDAENLVQTAYTVPNMYKTMQYAWYHNQFNENLGASFLALNTGYEYTRNPNTPESKILVDYKQTFGPYVTYKKGKLDTSFWVYGQTGKSNDHQVSAWNAAANLGYNITEAFKLDLGYEFLSGKSSNDGSTVIKSFNPLFGTNHGFNGYMDYFYVGNYTNSYGLQDAFIKLNYNVNKWQFALIPHMFLTAADVVNVPLNEKMDSYLGTEIDATFGYNFKKNITVTGGYSQMFGSKTMEFVKGGDTSHTNNWAWLMISVDPKIFSWKK